MQDKYQMMSTIDVVADIIKNNGEPVYIYDLLDKVAVVKKQLKNDDFINQLYMDITQSALFVFCGEDMWDLKENNLDQWDKDSFSFMNAADYAEDDEEELDFSEFTLEDDEEVEEEEVEVETVVDEEEKLAQVEEKEYIEVELSTTSTDDDDEEVEIQFDADYDEDSYNKIMDDYENMYEDE